METLLLELKRRWQGMFAALADGDDVPPSLRLRAEGMMEAALMIQAATQQELDEAMAELYEQAFGRTLAGDFGDDWRQFHPFPRIPAMGRRAPVYPSTKD